MKNSKKMLDSRNAYVFKMDTKRKNTNPNENTQ